MGAVFALGVAADVETAAPIAIALGMRTTFAVASGFIAFALAATRC